MRILAIVHQRDAGPGVFAEVVEARRTEVVEWLPASGDPPPAIDGFDGVMTYGGAMNVDQEDRHPWLATEKRLIAGALAADVPLLGVCLGAQLVAEAAGAAPRRASEPEIGWLEVSVHPEAAGDPLLGPLAPAFTAFQWHSYEFPLPPGATALASSPVCLQAFRRGNAWGIQFHAEVTLADAQAWTADYRADPDAVRIGLDPERLAAENRRRIAVWNGAGRALCERFLEAAAIRA
jgi:GMP synthase (glutamine-hydrolysing)